MNRWKEETIETKSDYALSMLSNPTFVHMAETEYYRLNYLYNISQFKK